MRKSSFLCVLVLCVGSVVYSEDSVNVELSKPGADVKLRCPLQPPVSWKKDNQILTTGTNYDVNVENGTLNIKKLNGELAGVYKCNNSRNDSELTVYAGSVVKKFADRSSVVVEGDKLELKCSAWGYPPPVISWKKISLDGTETQLPSGDSRVTLENADGLINASLTIKGVTLSDYGSYFCIADNGHQYNLENNSTVNSATILVRVKGKLTPLWPFIGIIIEIIILVTIIVVYERRKSKQTDSDDVKDSGSVVNSNDHKDSENLRSRK